jgi:two-component system sensor histidine kinase TctE
MRPLPKTGRSLWVTLAVWMLPVLAFLMAAGLFLTSHALHDVADSAYDRSLSGAIRAIDLNISTESGSVGVELPYPLFESFQATAEGEVYFRVSTDDGLVQIGEALLPPPPDLEQGQILFYDAVYFGRDVRVGAYKRPLDRPLYGAPTAQNLVIEVAETTGSREAFRRAVLSRALWRDMAAVAAAALLLAIGVHMALKPLRNLQGRLDRRSPDDLRQIDPEGLPREVAPLVASVNRLVDRHRSQGEAQRRYIEDASHQLKTPIAVLRAQIDYAARLEDLPRIREVLEAMRGITDRSSRLTSQLLALARARNAILWAGENAEPVNLATLLEEVARLHLPFALRRGVIIEVEIDEVTAPPPLHVPEALLFEAVSNLTENAVAASPAGGHVWLRAACDAGTFEIEVRDSGPGVAPAMMEHLSGGQRFGALAGRSFTAPQRGEAGSSGLGVAVVHEIMRAINGTLALQNCPSGGLSALITINSRERPFGKGRAQSQARTSATES